MKQAAVALMAAGVIVLVAVLALREEPSSPVELPEPIPGLPGPAPQRIEVPVVRTGDARLSGRVRAANGEPVAKAIVEVIFADRPSLPASCAALVEGCMCSDDLPEAIDALDRAFSPLAEVETGPDGTFRIAGLPAAKLEVRAHSDAKYGTAVVVLDDRAAQVELTADQQPSPFISVDPPGAVLFAFENGRFLDFARPKPGRSNRLLAPARTVRVIALDHAMGRLTAPREGLVSDDVATVRVTLRKGELLRGTLEGGGVGQLVRATSRGDGCATGITGPDGRWVLGPVEQGSYQVQARQGALLAEVTAETYRPVDGGVSMKLGAEVTIRGTVVDGRREPLTGVAVEITRFPVAGGSGVTREVLSGPGGAFEHHGPPGNYHLSAKQGARVPATQKNVVETGEWVVALQLIDAVEITGRIRSASGEPLVKPRLSGHTKNFVHFHAIMPAPTIEPSGAFRLEAVPGPVELTASAEGMLTKRLTVEAPAQGIDVMLERGGTIEGRVVDEKGAAVKGVHVSCSTNEFSVSDQSKEDGHFALSPVPDGTLEVKAQVSRRPEGFAPTSFRVFYERVGRAKVDVRHGRAPLVLIRLEEVRAVKGRVVDPQGRPLAGVALTAAQGEAPRLQGTLPYSMHRMVRSGNFTGMVNNFLPTTTSAADGTFRFEGLGDASFVLRGRGAGFREDAENPTIIKAGMEGVVLTLHPIHHLIVPVSASDGAALTKVSVGGEELVPEGGVVRSELFFTFSGPIGISAPGYALVQREISITPKADVTLAPVVLAKGRAVTLVLTDLKSGVALEGWLVVDGQWLPRTKRQGEYTVPIGAFEAKVGSAGHLDAVVQVGADQSQIAVALDPGATVQGPITDAAGKPLTGTTHMPVVEVGGKKVWGQVRSGSYTIAGVPRGAGKVWVHRPSDQKAGPATNVDIPASGTVTVPLVAH